MRCGGVCEEECGVARESMSGYGGEWMWDEGESVVGNGRVWDVGKWGAEGACGVGVLFWGVWKCTWICEGKYRGQCVGCGVFE